MNANRTAWQDGPRSAEWRQIGERAVGLASNAFRLALYAVMYASRPVVVVLLALMAIVGLVLCLFSLAFPPGTHFPTLVIALISVGSVVAIIAYHAVMDVVRPQ